MAALLGDVTACRPPLASLQLLMQVSWGSQRGALHSTSTWPLLPSLEVTAPVDLLAGLRQLAFLPLLQELNLAYTQIGDDGLQAIEPLTSLTSLNLDSCEVTDA